MSVSDFGKVTQSLQVSNLECIGNGSSSTSGSIHASGNISGRIITVHSSVLTISDDPELLQLTAADILGGIIHNTSGGTNLHLPSATSLIAAIPRYKIGMTLPLLVVHSGAGFVGTEATGLGSSQVPETILIATASAALFWIRITSASTYVMYRVSSS